MTIHSKITELKRPRILIKAARIGTRHYNRENQLKRILNTRNTPTPDKALLILMEKEDAINTSRLNDDAFYNIKQHISVLSALIYEMRLLNTY